MADEQHSFDSLGRIIGRESLLHIVRAIAGGRPFEAVVRDIQQRAKGVSAQQAEQFIGEVIEKAAAGPPGWIWYDQQLRGMADSDVPFIARGKVPLRDIPVNPFLFGDSPEGNRYSYGVEIEAYPGAPPRLIYIDSSRVLSAQELAERALGVARERIHESPKRFGVKTTRIVQPAILGVVSMERRY